jgi:hypothetical protein
MNKLLNLFKFSEELAESQKEYISLRQMKIVFIQKYIQVLNIIQFNRTIRMTKNYNIK